MLEPAIGKHQKTTYKEDLDEGMDACINLDARKRSIDLNSSNNLSASLNVSDDSGDGTGRVNMAV